MAPTKLTPAMEQYMHFKRQYQEAILFFRMGDFYEMFYDDARLAARLLGLTLTARNHGKSSGEVPLAGVPHHTVETYVARLIQMGRKVAICEQVEDPKKARGVVRRDVVQVVSPGTALSDAMLDQQRNNFLLALFAGKEKVGLASVDLSTGEFSLDEIAAGQLGDELERLAPAELLLSERADPSWVEALQRRCPRVALSRLEGWQFEYGQAREMLREQLKVHSLKGFDCEDIPLGICAAGAAVHYLRENQHGGVEHINRLVRRRRGRHLLLDAAAQRNLELLANQRDGSREGALLGVLDRTLTPMGARLLRQWIVSPLKEPAAVEQRLAAVAALLEEGARRQLRELLRPIGDLERMMARICCQRANARDLVGLARSLCAVPELRRKLRELPGELLTHLATERLPPTGELVRLVEEALVDEPPATLGEGGLIRKGYSPEVDQLRQTRSGGKEWIARLQTQERRRTGIASLKIGYNQVFGYYIEVSKANLAKVPADYLRKQTLANAERFITPELKECETRVLEAEERLKELENQLFLEVRRRVAGWAAPVQQSARTLAQVDTLASLAEVAHSENYTRPQVDDSTLIHIEAGRHPVVERRLEAGRFVPNDTCIDAEKAQILLVTGPNMAGKSTIIRQVGLIVLMAQMGSFVPARRARIGAVDRIFTRVGASDDLARGESTFMVEMNEAAAILNNLSPRSLILVDELGRGTSTFDGLSLAWAIVEYLHEGTQAHPRALFATHYHEMTALENTLARVQNHNVVVREEEGRIVFLHRLERGPCDRSYGINVAQMAGMPARVVARAREILSRLEKEQIDTRRIHPDGDEARPERSRSEPEAGTREQKDGLQRDSSVAAAGREAFMSAELLRTDLSRVTPLEALLKLNEWKKKLGE